MFTRIPMSNQRNGQAKRVLLICRSSRSDGTPRQENECEPITTNQEVRLQDWLRQNLNGPYSLIAVTIDAKGGRTQSTIKFLYAAIKTGRYDLVLFESLDRISRDPQLLPFLHFADRSKTKIVVIEDNFGNRAGEQT